MSGMGDDRGVSVRGDAVRGDAVHDLIVVGGGPGGLSAALAAAQAGARVTLLDAYPEPGGQYYHQPPERFLAEATPRQREGRALWQRAADAGVQVRSGVTVWNLDADKTLSLHGPGGVETVRARVVILATGAYERTAAFPGWTLPGVITSGAAQILLYGRVRPGRRVLLVGTGPLQLITAAALLKAGAQVAAVLEGARLERGLGGLPAMFGQWGRIREGLEALTLLARHGVPYRAGWGILVAHGEREVEGATIARLDRDWRPIPGSERAVSCDTICVGYGFAPFNALAKLAGAAQEWRSELGGEVPCRDEYMQTSIPGLYAVGDGAGVGGYRLALLEGQIAGLAAASALAGAAQGSGAERAGAASRAVMPALRREQAFQRLYARLFTPGPGIYELARPETVLCRCEGVTLGQLEAAAREGVTTVREAKAAVRCGMGECQGRTCGAQVTHTLARLAGKTVEEVGTYSARPPLFPIPIGSFQEE